MTATAYGPAFGDVDVTGDGTQNVFGTTVSGDLVQSQVTYVRGQPAFYLGADDVTDRVACYVPAGNHDLIVKALDANHGIALTGPPGCGRETMASPPSTSSTPASGSAGSPPTWRTSRRSARSEAAAIWHGRGRGTLAAQEPGRRRARRGRVSGGDRR